jgi:hypothetical protein
MVLGDGIRRDIMKVSEEEQERFVSAIIALNKEFFSADGNRDQFPAGHVSRWFKMDEIHQATHVHGTPSFLPWHRELCNRFEDMLREVDSKLSLHYWDWNKDPAPLFTPKLMGNSKGPAGEPWSSNKFYGKDEDGNFRDGDVHQLKNHEIPNPSIWHYDLGSNPADPPLRLDRSVENGIPPIGTPDWPSDADLIDSDTFEDFDNKMSLSHAAAHDYMGLGNAHISFRDPIVFLLHSNVDRLWALWQTQPGYRKDRLNPENAYGLYGLGPSINELLQPWAGWRVDLSNPNIWPTRPWYTPENEQFQDKNISTSKDPTIVYPPRYDTNVGHMTSLIELIEMIGFSTIDPCGDIVDEIRKLKARVDEIKGQLGKPGKGKIHQLLAQIARKNIQLAACRKERPQQIQKPLSIREFAHKNGPPISPPYSVIDVIRRLA